MSRDNLVDEKYEDMKNNNVDVRIYDNKFNDFLALTPKVNTINPRSPDLMTFQPRPQNSKKSIPEVPS